MGGGGAEMYHFFCQNQKLSGHSETQKTHTYLFKGGTIGTCIKISAKKDENWGNKDQKTAHC